MNHEATMPVTVVEFFSNEDNRECTYQPKRSCEQEERHQNKRSPQVVSDSSSRSGTLPKSREFAPDDDEGCTPSQ